MKMSIKILQGNCLETLSSLEEKSVNTCVTSPPYWGLRDYGNGDQLGQEETPEKFTENLVKLFREVRRVLRDDGTVWLNLGDSYIVVSGTKGQTTSIQVERNGRGLHAIIKVNGLKPKDLDRHSLACSFRTASRWLVSCVRILSGSKPNPMPESVTDRCTKAHEYIFLLSKSPKYYYDNEAIKEDSAESSKDRLNQDIKNQKGSSRVPGKTNGTMNAVGGEKRNKRSVWSVADAILL
jgi:hypothetical protein